MNCPQPTCIGSIEIENKLLGLVSSDFKQISYANGAVQIYELPETRRIPISIAGTLQFDVEPRQFDSTSRTKFSVALHNIDQSVVQLHMDYLAMLTEIANRVDISDAVPQDPYFHPEYNNARISCSPNIVSRLESSKGAKLSLTSFKTGKEVAIFGYFTSVQTYVHTMTGQFCMKMGFELSRLVSVSDKTMPIRTMMSSKRSAPRKRATVSKIKKASQILADESKIAASEEGEVVA